MFWERVSRGFSTRQSPAFRKMQRGKESRVELASALEKGDRLVTVFFLLPETFVRHLCFFQPCCVLSRQGNLTQRILAI